MLKVIWTNATLNFASEWKKYIFVHWAFNVIWEICIRL